MPSSKGVKKKQYLVDAMTRAEEAVKSGSMSCCAAAKFHGIPKSTLIDHLNGTPAQKKRGTREKLPRTVLSKQDETKLVNWILTCARRGRGITKEDICLQVLYLTSLSKNVKIK